MKQKLNNTTDFLLSSFDYNNVTELSKSMMPSLKYGITKTGIIFSGIGAIIENLIGISHTAFAALFIIMLIELISGLTASRIRGEQLSSKRWSRFGLKVGLWFIILFVTHVVANDFNERGFATVAAIINVVHTALILSIFFEYLLSVIENISTISGKDHAALINKIKNIFNSFFNNDNK